jgi:methylmalonyl-CoA mutase, C-terminal domain
MVRKERVLLAKLGLDVHNRGIITVALELKDAGMEVIYIGNATPREIVMAAIEECVDLVGVSSLGGAHMVLGGDLLEEAGREGLTREVGFIIGGVFPEEDITRLEGLGFRKVFVPGATRDEIVSAVKSIAKELSERANTKE